MTDASWEFTERNTPQRFSFTGDGGLYLLLIMKNVFLIIITFGIYWFWAKVDVIKFLYNNTHIQGHAFEYHATGWEKFVGFLKAFGVFFIVGLLNGILGWVLRTILGKSTGDIIAGLILYFLIFAVLPIIIIGGLRFRYSRTSLNGIRFQFLGNPKEFTILFLKQVGLTIITFGIYYPWAQVAITTYITQNTLFGNHAFDLRVKAEELFFTFLKGFFLTFITLGIYSFWLRANIFNIFWNNYYFQNGKTVSELTGGKLLIVFLKSAGLVLITFGFAIPWVVLMNSKVLVENVSFSTSIDFDSISDIPIKPGSAMIENIGGDALDSIGSIAG